MLLLSWLWRKNSYWTCAAFLSNTYLPNVFLSRLERSENQTKYFGIFRRLKKEINIGIKRVKQMSHISKKIIEFQSICYWRQKSLFHSCCCFGRFLQHLQNDTWWWSPIDTPTHTRCLSIARPIPAVFWHGIHGCGFSDVIQWHHSIRPIDNISYRARGLLHVISHAYG